MQQRFYLSARVKLGVMLAVSCLASVVLYIAGAVSNHDAAFSYLPTNLLLAWVPLVLALWLERTLRHHIWSSWYALGVTVLWLVFLPNTFYMISDFIHLNEAARVDLLYDVVLFTSFICNGFILGFLSLYVIHWELARRVSKYTALALIEAVLFLCSFAIYIGRELRWNSWDLLANPASLLVDISDKLINPKNHPQLLATTLSFFILLSTMYGVLWYIARLPRPHQSADLK
jgi:uncharacterized membrane protein